MRARKNSGGLGDWLARIGLFALLVAAPAFCWAAPHRGGGRGGFSSFQAQDRRHEAARPREGGGARPAMHSAGNRGRPQPRPEARQQQPRPDYRQEARPEQGGNMRSDGGRGQEHLPQWWQAHRGLSPQQQADALRRQPGFRNLPQGQQQRLIQRLHDFDRRSPAEQRRTLGRVEMFERLSPERRQEVRGASQALSRMPANRQRMMRQAFHELRQLPPQEREQMLRSGYGAQFTPRERTVLGNLLSIEPYQPQGQIAQPYFGR